MITVEQCARTLVMMRLFSSSTFAASSVNPSFSFIHPTCLPTSSSSNDSLALTRSTSQRKQLPKSLVADASTAGCTDVRMLTKSLLMTYRSLGLQPCP